MSFIPGQVTFQDSPQVDDFSRLQVAPSETLFECLLVYGDNPTFWENSVSGTGSVVSGITAQGVGLTTGGTSSGALVKYQTHQYFFARAGQDIGIIMAVQYGTAATNLRRRAGWFDDNNGVYLEQVSTGLSIVLRSNITGSVVNTSVAQSSWNGDKLDGTGASGLTLDMTKVALMYIIFGDGRIRFMFVVNGQDVLAHSIDIAGAGGMAFRILPLRVEMENTGATSGTNTMNVKAAGVYTLGDSRPFRNNQQFLSAANTSLPTITTRRPLLSVRPKTTFNSATFRGFLSFNSAEIISDAGGGVLYWEIVKNASLTGASWTSLGSNTVSEYDTAATALSGGTVIVSGFINAGTSSPSIDLTDNAFHNALGNDFAGTTADILTIAVTKISGGATTASAAFNWHEQR